MKERRNSSRGLGVFNVESLYRRRLNRSPTKTTTGVDFASLLFKRIETTKSPFIFQTFNLCETKLIAKMNTYIYIYKTETCRRIKKRRSNDERLREDEASLKNDVIRFKCTFFSLFLSSFFFFFQLYSHHQLSRVCSFLSFHHYRRSNARYNLNS